MARFSRVFVGAPTTQDATHALSSYHWQTVSSSTPPNFTLPPATLEEATRRISLLYQNIIFRDSDANEGDPEDGDESPENSAVQDETTAITWPSTAQDASASQTASRTGASPHPAASAPRPRSQETQETQDTASYNYSDASSIARFPAFHFSPHALTPLSALAARRAPATVLAAVLEADGPAAVRIARGAHAGRTAALLTLVLGAPDGVCRVAAWRGTADAWRGVARGDVVLLARVRAAGAGALTASPALGSTLEVCYRTLPARAADARLRPDLRLGRSDAAVRRVAAVVGWFERMAGLTAG